MKPAVALPDAFTGVSVIITVVNETESLDQTIRMLHESSNEDIREVLIVVCEKTTPESLARCEAAKEVFGDRVVVHWQRLPYLGGAIRDAFAVATASHTIMMASDLETDPAIVPDMIELARKHPEAIVTASRWAAGGSFSGYGPHRVALNWLFQRIVSLVFRTKLSDATFGYRLFPTSLVQTIEWEGLRHEFLLETLLKPLRLGIDVYEVPTRWLPRPEGESQNSVATQARYIPLMIKNRFVSTTSFVRKQKEIA